MAAANALATLVQQMHISAHYSIDERAREFYFAPLLSLSFPTRYSSFSIFYFCFLSVFLLIIETRTLRSWTWVPKKNGLPDSIFMTSREPSEENNNSVSKLKRINISHVYNI